MVDFRSCILVELHEYLKSCTCLQRETGITSVDLQARQLVLPSVGTAEARAGVGEFSWGANFRYFHG